MSRLQARVLFVLPRALGADAQEDSAERENSAPEGPRHSAKSGRLSGGLVEAPVQSEVVDPYKPSVRGRRRTESSGGSLGINPGKGSRTPESPRDSAKSGRLSGGPVDSPAQSEVVAPHKPSVRGHKRAESSGDSLGINPGKGGRVFGIEPRRPARSSVRVMGAGTEDGYDGDLDRKVHDYAGRCVGIARQELFDVIHAHDWMTFPAAMAIADLSGRPLVVHVHATEFDRAGENTNRTIYEFERMGMQAADLVIAVSRRTKQVIVERYGIPAEKVRVVYNGIENGVPEPPQPRQGSEKVVLFLGRITMQKGTEYFIRAAAKVAEKVDNAKFIVAGAGDQLAYVRRLASDVGIGDRVEFAGFLHGDDVDRMYQRADVYVMPSVSEPFGLTALEAARHGVPVIISRSSGVAEVLARGSLKVDFWDVDRMARMIVSVLERPRLADTLRRRSSREISDLTWDEAARKCMRFYYRTVVWSAERGRASQAVAV